MLRLSSSFSKAALRAGAASSSASLACYSTASSYTLPTPPSYTALSSHQFANLPIDSTTRSEEFSKTLDELNHRLRPLEIPASSRPYVFRPKNARLLPQIEVTDKAGNRILESEVIKGKPNSKILLKLIRNAYTTTEAVEEQNISTVISKMNLYSRYYPSQLNSNHVCALLTVGAKSGALYQVMDYVFDKLLAAQPQLLNIEVAREALRLYAVRAATLEKKEAGAKELVKLWHKIHNALLKRQQQQKAVDASASLQDDLQANLIMVYGLATQFGLLEKQEDARALISPYLSSVARLIEQEQAQQVNTNIETTQQPSKTQLKKAALGHGIRFKYTDYLLGQQGLAAVAATDSALLSSKFSVDTAKLDGLVAEIATAFQTFGLKLELARYVELVAQGILRNTQKVKEVSGAKFKQAQEEGEKAEEK